jgi:hypothetical protein
MCCSLCWHLNGFIYRLQYCTSLQNIIIWKYLVDIRSEAWLYLFWGIHKWKIDCSVLVSKAVWALLAIAFLTANNWTTGRGNFKDGNSLKIYATHPLMKTCRRTTLLARSISIDSTFEIHQRTHHFHRQTQFLHGLFRCDLYNDSTKSLKWKVWT